MGEIWGVLAAVLSSALGGTAIGATRYLRQAADPLVLGVFRFGLGCLVLIPAALLGRRRWPPRRDWPATAALGLLFFALFPILFNASLIFTTAARGSLALSTLPLLSMVAGALLGAESLTLRKTAGVLVAMAGVAAALLSGLASAPPGAWRGDALMAGGALCMALYGVWSKPFIRRSDPLTFAAMGMGIGTLCLAALAAARGSFAAVAQFETAQWVGIVYLGLVGGALIFFLWAFALGRTTPTRVAVSIAVNPVSASLLGALLLGEPVGPGLAIGLVGVICGISIATTDAKPAAAEAALPRSPRNG